MADESPSRKEAHAIAGDCYYEHTIERGPLRPSLEGTLDADVAVVGAGAAGLNCALELAERGFSVAVLEAERIGAAASGRNGGQVLPGFSADLEVLARDLGLSGAQALWNLSVEGMRIVEQRARAEAPDACEIRAGWMMLAARASHVAGLRAWHRELIHTLAYDRVDFIEAKELSQWCGASGFHAALLDHSASHLNPLKLMLSLARQAEAKGVRIFERSPVTSTHASTTAMLKTEQGEVRCRYVVLAANVFVDGLNADISERIMSVGNTMIATEVLPEALAQSLCPNGYAGCDTNFMLDYFRVSVDHRLLYGGASTYLRHNGPERAQVLERKMRLRFPQLADFAVQHAWGGLIDVTANRAPDFGRLAKSIYYLQGFSGHGLNVSAIGARVVAEAIGGDSTRLGQFARLRHRRFPRSTLLKRALLSMGTWAYRMRDQLG